MASRGVNKVILVGNLGQDPEMRYMPNGGAVANLRLATSESWRDKATGEQKEVTEWHTVVIFGKLAEIAGEYLRKGSQVYIEGQLRTRKWQDKDQQDRYSTEIVVSMNGVMQMLGGRQGGGAPAGQGGGWGQPQQPQFSGGGAPAAAPGAQGQQPHRARCRTLKMIFHSRRSHFPSLTMRFTRCNENKAPSGAFLMRAEVRPSRNAPRRRTRPDPAYPTDSHDTQGRCILRGWTCLPGFLAAVKQTSLPR